MKSKLFTLLSRHKGKGNAITINYIVRALRLQGMGTTGYPVRMAIKELIQKDGVPIGSCTKGFYLIENEMERLQVIDNLVARQNGISSRIRALRGCKI